MKRTFVIISLLALLGIAYHWSYRSSSISSVGPKGNDRQLVIAGVSFPYSEKSIRNFNILYGPLIDHSTDNLPTESIKGSIRKLSSPSDAISIDDESGGKFLIRFPDSMKNQITGFSTGDTVHATYKQKPDKQTVFHTYFELQSISHVSEDAD